jgi:hypothetical protein
VHGAVWSVATSFAASSAATSFAATSSAATSFAASFAGVIPPSTPFIGDAPHATIAAPIASAPTHPSTLRKSMWGYSLWYRSRVASVCFDGGSVNR